MNDALSIVNDPVLALAEKEDLLKPGPIKVAIIDQDENGKGTIDLWEVDGEKFDQEVTFIYPTSDEDWITVKKWVEENGKKIQTIEVDYSINLCLLLEDYGSHLSLVHLARGLCGREGLPVQGRLG